MKQKPNYGSQRQQGIALPIIMIILVLAALVTIYTTTTSVKEQQVTADQYRSEQAFSTAQAGVDVALERHNHFESFTVDGCNIVVPPETDITSDCTDFSDSEKGSFTVMFCDIWDDAEDADKSAVLMKAFLTDIDSCTNPINTATTDEPDGFLNDARVGILSVGKPDDESGRRTISIVSAPARITGSSGPPLQPLVAGSNVDVTGTMRVINRYSNATVWSGKDMDTSGNMQTYVNDGTLDPATADRQDLINTDKPPLDPNKPNSEFYNAMLSSGKDIGHNSDVIDNDFNLDGLTEDAMFEGFFSASRSEIKGMADVYSDVTQIADQTGLIWVATDKLGQVPSLGNCLVDPPVTAILVIETEDRIQFTGGGSICGMVFVFGDVDTMAGGFTVYGSMVVTGAMDLGAGTADIVYDPEAITEPPEGLKGSRGVDAGTWKDWGYVN